MRTLLSYAGLIGSVWTNGTFVRFDSGLVAFCVKVGRNHDTARWVPTDLPTAFRSQLDINSTASMLGARSIGGKVSANVIGDRHAVGWKAERGDWSLDDVTAKMSKADVKGLHAYYSEDEVEIAA